MPAARFGKCTNFGNCATADSGKVVQVASGDDLRCPECQRALTELAPARAAAPSSSTAMLVVLLLVILGSYFFYRSRKPRAVDNAPVASSESAPSSDAPSRVTLRLCGSNTIGAQLAPALVSAFLKSTGVSSVPITHTAPDEMKVGGAGATDAVFIAAHGTATAFDGLAAGTCDIGMASRQIKAAESAKLSSLGDMTSPANEHVLGLDGIAVIVNQANPLSALTIKQAAALFSGATATWPDGSAVKVFARDDKSGTYDTFKTLVLGAAVLTPGAQRLEDSRALSDAVASDRNAIGFVGLPYIGSTKALAISEPGAQALVPNKFTVATEDYALSRRLYFYTSSSPRPFTQRFIAFVLSKEGQDVVGANGFVEQNIHVQQTSTVPRDASTPYQQATRNAQRLSVDFRFRTGSSELDNKALADVDRVTALLSDLHYTGQNVLLLGFADSTGTAAKNLTLSKDRSHAVGDHFTQRGVSPGLVTGFGAEMPVASNENEEGRQKNRRVEIWVKQ